MSCAAFALLHSRRHEVTDALVDLLIATVHRIAARAEWRVTNEMVNAFKRVTGKESILFAIADDRHPDLSGGEVARR